MQSPQPGAARQDHDPGQDRHRARQAPLYEQIYALAGLTLYYRITGDWQVLQDIRRTVAAMLTI